ncbi:MAG: replication factor C large subunit [Candidatus Diapherotrites archaeon]
MPKQLWTEKYFPKSFEDFVGNSDIVSQVKSWALAWEQGKPQIPLLLWGSTGTGKTTLAYLIAKLMKWDLFELNASDFRSKEVIEKIVAAACQNTSFSGKKRLILLDEIDGLHKNDKGGAQAIASLLGNSQNPMVLTANEIYGDKKFQGIRLASKTLEFKKINYLSIASRLNALCIKEGIAFEEEAVKELAKNSNGDFRSALLDLQSLSFEKKIDFDVVNSLGERDRQQKIFAVMKEIFKGTDFTKIREARFASDLNFDLLLAWIEENIPRQYTVPEDCAEAFNYLSRADIFHGRIYIAQDYSLLKYTMDLATEGVALSKKNEYNSFVPYQFPSLISRLSRSTSQRAFKKAIAKKFGEKMNSSSRKVISQDLKFIKIIFADKEKAVNFASEFDLNEKEIAYLMDSKPETKKVKSIFDEANELRKKQLAEKSSRVIKTFGGKRIAEELVEKEKPQEEESEEKESEEKIKSEPKTKQMKLF